MFIPNSVKSSHVHKTQACHKCASQAMASENFITLKTKSSCQLSLAGPVSVAHTEIEDKQIVYV